MAKKDPSPTAYMKAPVGQQRRLKQDPEEYFFVADYNPEDQDQFDNEMITDPFAYTPEGLQEAMAALNQAQEAAGYTRALQIYRRKFSEGRGDSEEEIISDPYNYQFTKK